MFWIGFAVGLAVGVVGYFLYDKYHVGDVLVRFEQRLANIEKSITKR